MATSVILLLQYTILPLLSICLLFLLRRHQPPPSKKSSPPSPPRLPIIGNFHQLGTLPHQSFRSLSQKHGDLILLHLGSKPALLASSVDAASLIMKTHDLAFCSKPQSSFFVRLVNNGKDVVGAPYGDDWRNMKNICVQELLSKTRVQAFRGVREDEVARMVQRVTKGAVAGGVVDLREAFVTMTEDSISRATLGVKYKRDRRGVDVGKVMSEMTELMGRVLIGECIPWLGWMDGRAKASADRVNKEFDDFLERVISERCADKREGNGNEGGGNKDFVDVLLEVQRGIGTTTRYMPIDKESIKGILLDMFIAGIEPLSSALEWIMAMLLKTPRVMEKLQQEIRESAKGKNTLVDDDLKTMVYLKAVIQETLRLHPPASLLSPRECIQDVRINGFDIAAGTMVFINGWAIGRDPKHWEEPERFLPERFLKSPTEFKPHDLGMVPFGYGRRNCPGESFAIAMIELAIANLVLKFDWALPFGAEGETLDMKEGPGIITKRMAPLLAVATPWVL